MSLMPVVYVAHGGGPMPLMGDPNHADLTNYMRGFAARFPAPKAILVVTAHWEEASVCVTAHPNPSLLFDYYGFPPETYHYQYPAPGNPDLAKRVVSLIEQQGIAVQLDTQRGFDHGTFVPLMLMYPTAEIPVVQMSLKVGLNPAEHIRIGQALSALREQGVLIVGSGLSFHNMRAFFAADASKLPRSQAFDQWLVQSLCDSSLSASERAERLANWLAAPEARFCHPREEHLLPLQVCLGAASCAQARHDFSSTLFDTAISGFLWAE